MSACALRRFNVRMSSAVTAGGTVNYLYNALDQRVSKTGPTALVPTGASYFVYDEAGKMLGEYDASGAPIYETVYLGMAPVAAIKQTGTAAGSNIAVAVYNVHSDHLGAPRVITRQSDNAIMWRWDTAESYGGTAPDQNPTAQGVFTYNVRFPGQTYDAETGLFQNWRREYNPRIGRYMQSDPIGLGGGINTYEYVGGAPTMLVDPTGEAAGQGQDNGMTPVNKGSGQAAPLLPIAGIVVGTLMPAMIPAVFPGAVVGAGVVSIGSAIDAYIYSKWIAGKPTETAAVDSALSFCTGWGSGALAGKFVGPQFMAANGALKTWLAQSAARVPGNAVGGYINQLRNPTEFSDGTIGIDYVSVGVQTAVGAGLGGATNGPYLNKTLGYYRAPPTSSTAWKIGSGAALIVAHQTPSRLINGAIDKSMRDNNCGCNK